MSEKCREHQRCSPDAYSEDSLPIELIAPHNSFHLAKGPKIRRLCESTLKWGLLMTAIQGVLLALTTGWVAVSLFTAYLLWGSTREPR
jgi:hypothetical protein